MFASPGGEGSPILRRGQQFQLIQRQRRAAAGVDHTGYTNPQAGVWQCFVRAVSSICRLKLGFERKVTNKDCEDAAEKTGFGLVGIILDPAFVAPMPVQNIAFQFEPIARFR